MAYMVMTYTVMAYIGMAYMVMTYIAMAYIVMAYMTMACIAMAYVVMANIVMAVVQEKLSVGLCALSPDKVTALHSYGPQGGWPMWLWPM